LLKPDFNFISASPARFIAFGFGSGLISNAPGTVGSAVGVLLYILLSLFLNKIFIAALVIIFFIIGVRACEQTGRDLGVADHGGMVWDEIVAMMLVLLFMPPSLVLYGLAFAVFRMFDILKPFPINWLENKYKGGFGVMVDDVMAAIYSIAMLWALIASLNFSN
jgi:phosphatidylglycerophosphatase A